MTEPTKLALMTAWRSELLARYDWAKDTLKLNNFLTRALSDFRCGSRGTNIDGEAFRTAWQSIGCKGKPTYKAVVALADDPNIAPELPQ